MSTQVKIELREDRQEAKPGAKNNWCNSTCLLKLDIPIKTKKISKCNALIHHKILENKKYLQKHRQL